MAETQRTFRLGFDISDIQAFVRGIDPARFDVAAYDEAMSADPASLFELTRRLQADNLIMVVGPSAKFRAMARP